MYLPSRYNIATNMKYVTCCEESKASTFLTLIWYVYFEEMKFKQGEVNRFIYRRTIKTGHRVAKKCVDGKTND